MKNEKWEMGKKFFLNTECADFYNSTGLNFLRFDIIRLFHEPLVCPLEAIPTWNEYSTSDILVKNKGEPHTDKSKTEHNTEEIAETYANEPLHDDSKIEREEYITRCTKRVCSPDIDALTNLKQYIHPETPAYKGGDFLIIRKWISDEWAE